LGPKARRIPTFSQKPQEDGAPGQVLEVHRMPGLRPRPPGGGLPGKQRYLRRWEPKTAIGDKRLRK